MPAGIEGFRVAGKVIEEWKQQEGQRSQQQVDSNADVGLEQRVSGENV